LVVVLASTPCEALSREEMDALCQVSYELQERLAEAVGHLREFEKVAR